MKELQIISFNYPYPPSYGGIIDVYYKLKSLSDLGIKIQLHCFVEQVPDKVHIEISTIVENVYFYQKKKNLFLFFSLQPFAILIRDSDLLLQNIEKSNAPILFEGVQTTRILKYLKNKSYKLYLRFHNNEYEYYKGISLSERNLIKKIIYRIESIKFKFYQKNNLKKFHAVFCLSNKEYIDVNAISKNANLIHIFHGNSHVKPITGKGKYFFFHGDLKISDNQRALNEVIKIFQSLPKYQLVVASDKANEKIIKKIGRSPNIRLVSVENNENLNKLFENAQANILLSYQSSGTKVKLFNTLYNSRFVIINNNITDDNSLKNLCSLVNDSDEIPDKIIEVAELDYDLGALRKEILEKNYSDIPKAEEIINVIFNEPRHL